MVLFLVNGKPDSQKKKKAVWHEAAEFGWSQSAMMDSTQAATSLPDSIVGRRMACQSGIHVAALGGRRGDC